MSQTMIIPFSGQEIGQGLNSQSSEGLGTALSTDKDPAADGQQTTTRFDSVNTQESLMETLGVAVSVDSGTTCSLQFARYLTSQVLSDILKRAEKHGFFYPSRYFRNGPWA